MIARMNGHTLLQLMQSQYLSFSRMCSNLMGESSSNLKLSSIILHVVYNRFSTLS